MRSGLKHLNFKCLKTVLLSAQEVGVLRCL